MKSWLKHGTRPLTLGLCLALLVPAAAEGQWKNRYPKVDGYSHHVYLEGYELPILSNGPIDPAPSPDGGRVAFSSRGWIWILDLESGAARRLTRGGELDSRPAWSPNGQLIAFVRDDGLDTEIVVVEARAGAELGHIDSPALELDPAFSVDGREVYYSSGEAGDLDLWAMDATTGEKRRITSERGIELRPQPGAGSLIYLAKEGYDNRIEAMPADGGPVTTLLEGKIASMARPALSPDGSMIAINWPTQEGWDLRLMDAREPGPFVLLASGGLPLTPAWSADGLWIYFSEADERERMHLKRVRAVGGRSEEVPVRSWDWGSPTATLRIRTTFEAGGEPVPARLNVLDGSAHAAVPSETAARFDGQSGRVYFYSPGVIEITVPVGSTTISAVQGLATPEVTQTVELLPQFTTEVEIVLSRVWDAAAAGWTSGDHHFHLNYGGPYDLSPQDLVPMMRGEGLDVATPLLANLHTRFEDQDLWGWQKSDAPPLIRFGQEVRSHFLGHVGLIEINELFWPWVWGPGYEIYGEDDRENADALGHARAQGGMGYYVHPLSPRGARPVPWSEMPFPELMPSVPVELVADAVLGDLDALEIVCLWSDEVSTAQLWHRLLNLGLPIAPSAGTDVMTDFYRTMAVGTARVYVRTDDEVNWPGYTRALREGRSFVTNGPMLDFRVDGAGPGEVVGPGGAASRRVGWELALASASGVERVDVLVNGEVVWTGEGLTDAGARTFSGELDLPAGGWIAARAVGGEATWPAMADYPFAHTAPVWIGEIGSVEPAARRASASELLEVLDISQARLEQGYAGVEIPKLRARFAAARALLEAWARQ